jgi:hypothetical protein
MTTWRLLLAIMVLPWLAGPAAAQVLTPKQAAARVDQKVTVEFLVQANGYNDTGFQELYSEKTWDHPDNLFVRFPVKVWARLQKLGLFKPEEHFQGKYLRVTGTVTLLDFGPKGKIPAIYVDDLDQVEVLPAKYDRQRLDGFTVFVNQDLLAKRSEAGPALKELKKQLAAIVQVVPARPLKKLREVPIRLERDENPKLAACYVWGEWKKDMNPKLNSGLVVLLNARLFVEWSQGEQPWMVLHELAHAYHHRVLGEHHAGIEAAYNQAMSRKLYDSVAYVKGGKVKGYQTTNAMEYFAELTEAYFGKNDLYPFTRGELKEHDSVGFRLMQQVWEK